MKNLKFEYGFESVNGIIKKVYALSEIPNIREKCDIWNVLPIKYVRQFTGLQCKNQRDLYEGDRCKYHHNTSKWLVSYTFEIIFKDGSFYAYWERMMRGTLEKHFDLLSKIDRSKVKVIGNIYDTTIKQNN